MHRHLHGLPTHQIWLLLLNLLLPLNELRLSRGWIHFGHSWALKRELLLLLLLRIYILLIYLRSHLRGPQLPYVILGAINHHGLRTASTRGWLWALVWRLVHGCHEVVELCIWLRLLLQLRLNRGSPFELWLSVDWGSSGHGFQCVLINSDLFDIPDLSSQAELLLFHLLLGQLFTWWNIWLAAGPPAGGYVTGAFL